MKAICYPFPINFLFPKKRVKSIKLMSANNCSIARKTFYFLLEVTNVLLTMETFPRNGAKNVFLQMCVLCIV